MFVVVTVYGACVDCVRTQCVWAVGACETYMHSMLIAVPVWVRERVGVRGVGEKSVVSSLRATPAPSGLSI